jgi:hypothetical protein
MTDPSGYAKTLALPAGFDAPRLLRYDDVTAHAITRDDLGADVRGINASLDLIRETRGGTWPTGPVTEEEGLRRPGPARVRVPGRQVIHVLRRGRGGGYIGCAYLLPSGAQRLERTFTRGEQLLGGLVEAFAVGGATLATFLVAEPSAISGSHRIPHVSVARPGGGPFPDPTRPQGAKLGRGRPVTGPATGLPRILQTSSRRPQVRRQPARGSPNRMQNLHAASSSLLARSTTNDLRAASCRVSSDLAHPALGHRVLR